MRLELAEGLHQLRAVHPRQQLAARLPVAVLARERPAELHHEVGGLLDEPAIGRDALGGLQVEVDARVHAALAEVAVERPGVAVLGHQRRAAGADTRRGARAGRRRLPSPPSSWLHRARRRWRRAPTRARPTRAVSRPGRGRAASPARPGGGGAAPSAARPALRPRPRCRRRTRRRANPALPAAGRAPSGSGSSCGSDGRAVRRCPRGRSGRPPSPLRPHRPRGRCPRIPGRGATGTAGWGPAWSSPREW